jgi:hypothetical protein
MSEAQYGKGYLPRDYQSHPYGQIVGIVPFSMPLIPRSEWKERIAEKTANKSWLKDRIERDGIKRKQQSTYPWCHAAAPVGAAELARVVAGMKFVELSIASVGGPVTGWRMQGAYIYDDLKQCEKVGIAETSVFPDLTTDRKLWTPAVEANAAKHRVKGMDLDPNAWDQYVTACLADIATVYGVYDWGHATMGAVKAYWVNGQVELEAANNWGDDWNDTKLKAERGFYRVKEGGYHAPSEGYAILAVA